jgi:hypothetical protein
LGINDFGLRSIQNDFDFRIDDFEGNLTVDFNESRVLSNQDIFDVLAAYFAGC